MTNIITNSIDINQVIGELKEYQELEDRLKKLTYREVISNRFDSTNLKKLHAELYKAFSKATYSMRFTCN